MKEKFARFVQDHPIWTFVIGCAVILLIPALFTFKVSFLPGYLVSGQIGDTIGGTTAPFIGLFSAILVYLSFQEQIKANKLLTKQRQEDITIQNITDQIARIEATIKSYSHPQYNPVNSQQEQLYGTSGIIGFGRYLSYVGESMKTAKFNCEQNPKNVEYERHFENCKTMLSEAVNSIQLRGIGHILNLMRHMLKYLEKRESSLNQEAVSFNFDILTFIFYNDMKLTLDIISNLSESMQPYVGNVFKTMKSRQLEMEQILNEKINKTQ